MQAKGIIDEDFVNYKKPSLFIITTKCSMKCNSPNHIYCQNYDLLKSPDIEISKEEYEQAQEHGAKYIITAREIDEIADAKVEEIEGHYYLTYKRGKKV